MRVIVVLIACLAGYGCASEYDHVRIKAGLEMPSFFVPIDVGVTIELKDALEEIKTDEEIFQELIDQYALDSMLADDGVRKP